MKIKQSEINPFKNSDTNKRYYTYDYYLRKTFGGKCMKIPLDAGFTCPNIDGRCSAGGASIARPAVAVTSRRTLFCLWLNSLRL